MAILKNKQEDGKVINLIKVLNQDGKLVVTSRQISQDFEKEHNDTKKRIRELIKDMGEISHNYFILSEYVDSMNRTQEEYLLTRDGFSLLVMGFTGVKALEWKLKYIEAFNKMEHLLKEQKQLSPMDQLKLQYQVLEDHQEKLVELDCKVEDLENNMPLFNVECKELQSLVRKVSTKVLGGYRTPAYCDNSLRGKVYADIQNQLKRQFGVQRYEAIKRKQLEVAKNILREYKVPLVLESEITTINSQLAMDEVACTK